MAGTRFLTASEGAKNQFSRKTDTFGSSSAPRKPPTTSTSKTVWYKESQDVASYIRTASLMTEVTRQKILGRHTAKPRCRSARVFCPAASSSRKEPIADAQ